ncbi:MAG: RGCVC family protein [Actinophytocola sp.]|uniref:RGCVC family protein n=1 Tax=Actinophytocola sp. TaxID=1872138 RepID=UPI003C753D97
MTTPSPTTQILATETDKRCAACQHSWAAHDGIGARFCAATIVNGSTRGCVCAPDTAMSEPDVTD